MNEDFSYGPIAKGLYIALLGFTALAAMTPFLIWYLLFLLFLGVGLKPFLIHTGLRRIWLSHRAEVQRRRNAPHHARAARRIERERRDEKLRKTRVRDPNLPDRW